MEIDCRLPDEVVDVIRGAGVFRMPMPAAWGRPELPMVEILEVIEALSYVEGAVGWCAMIGCDAAFYSAWLDEDVGRAMFEDLDSITAGWVMPAGTATPTEGGYRLSGTWSFGSGSTHADWFCNGALVSDTLEWRLMFVPTGNVSVLAGTWDTTGLRVREATTTASTTCSFPRNGPSRSRSARGGREASTPTPRRSR